MSEWREQYLANVRSLDDLDAVAARVWAHFLEYQAVGKTLTQADFRAYIEDLVIERTFDGWMNRRELVRNFVRSETGIPFDYLRDSPVDWRPRTYDLDFAAEHPASHYWLGVKAFPVSTLGAPYPGILARVTDLQAKHREFEDKLGRAMLIEFNADKPKSCVSVEDLDKLRAAWDELGASTS